MEGYNRHIDETGSTYYVNHEDPEDRIYLAEDGENLYYKLDGKLKFLHTGRPQCKCLECRIRVREMANDNLPNVWERKEIDMDTVDETIEVEAGTVATEDQDSTETVVSAAPDAAPDATPDAPEAPAAPAPEAAPKGCGFRVQREDGGWNVCRGDGYLETGNRGRPPRCNSCNPAPVVAKEPKAPKAAKEPKAPKLPDLSKVPTDFLVAELNARLAQESAPAPTAE